MTIKPDKWTRRMVQEHGMTEPFVRRQVRDADGSWVISYGVPSYSYDMHCIAEFKVLINIHSVVVDPKNFDEKSFVGINSNVCIVPPNSFALARTAGYFRIPRNILAICLGKNTYTRYGIIVNTTPLESRWEGHVASEFFNTTNLLAKICANKGVAQMFLLQSDETCEVFYKDCGSKYQGQHGVILPKI